MLKAALAQVNPTVGDLPGNVRLLEAAARAAHAAGARVVLAPELALTGYPPEDLLLRPAFLQACEVALQQLAEGLSDLQGLHLVVGHPARAPQRVDTRSKSRAVPELFNAASVLADGRVAGTYFKRELPNYQVFDERRYFVSGREAGHGPLVFEVDGTAAETERVMWLRYVAAAKGWAFHTAHSTSESAAVALTLLAKELYDDETLLTGVLGAVSSAPSSAPSIPPITSQCSSLAEFISLVERSHAAFLRLVRIEHAGTVLWRRASCSWHRRLP
jgi:hypothetical protein